jgi:hypothetical protein
MRLFDRIDGKVQANSPIPPYLALPAMLPEAERATAEAWMARHGREFDQLTPPHDGAARGASAPEVVSAVWACAQRALEGASPDGWVLDGIHHRIASGDEAALTALYKASGGAATFALQLEPRDTARKAFARTRDFNVSYLRSFQGVPCSADDALLRACISALTRAESEGR